MMRVAGGFLDLQINGGWGHHFSESPESIWDVGEQLVAHGVTAFLPTLVSDGYERLDDALDVLAAGPPSGWRGAEPIGLHLEGPWLAADRRGAHSQNAIQAPDLASLPDRLRASAGVALVTIAPEIAGAGPVIRELRDRGVAVSCGHSAASLDEALAAFDAGAGMGTHLFNAMSGLHHRDPGLAAALLLHPTVAVGLIADGVHVHPTMIDLAWRLASDRIVLVSDAVAGFGLTEDPAARLADGTLAGATVGLDQCVRNVVEFVGCSLDDAVIAASARPAALIGHVPAPDTWVDIDDDGLVVRTVISGATVYEVAPD